MTKKWHLARIEHDRPITKATDPEFLMKYQHLVLLVLKECNLLTPMQCRCGDEILQRQCKKASFLR